MKHWVKVGLASLFLVGTMVAGQCVTTTSETVRATTAQGPYISDGRYVTVTAKNGVAWTSFDWKTFFANGANLYHKTFLSRGLYHHSNGSTYLSLYDHTGQWKGYINQISVTETGQQGLWNSANGYATLNQPSQPIYTDFSGNATRTSDAQLGQTYRVTGQYNWFDGMV